MYTATSLVPRLSAQLFFARSKISGYFTTCEKKLGREPGNEATLPQELHSLLIIHVVFTNFCDLKNYIIHTGGKVIL